MYANLGKKPKPASTVEFRLKVNSSIRTELIIKTESFNYANVLTYARAKLLNEAANVKALHLCHLLGGRRSFVRTSTHAGYVSAYFQVVVEGTVDHLSVPGQTFVNTAVDVTFAE